MTKSFLLEAGNANFMVLSLCAMFIFTYYMVKNWSEGYKFLQPAIALWAIFAGEFITRANFWWARHQINLGNGYAIWSDVLTHIGFGLTSWAILCIIAVFAPEKWRTRAWVLSATASAVFMILALSQVF